MSLPPDSERAVGIEVYATNSPPCSARLRTEPEDFVVEEAFGLGVVSSAPSAGSVPLYRVEKRGIDTLHVAKALATALKSRVAYAGMKDKRAAAVQYMTPTSSRAERPNEVNERNFSAKLVGYLPRPMSRSMVAGNRFEITLRECCAEIGPRISHVLAAAASLKVPNFYGLQRFGAKDQVTHLVGREVVRGRFDEALRILLAEPRSSDDDKTAEARRLLAGGRYAEGVKLLPERQDVEKAVARRMAAKPGDHVGAFRAAPVAVRRLYVQAFQSYIFNRTLSGAIAAGIDIASASPGDNWGELAADGLNLAKVHGVHDPMAEGAVPLVQLLGYAYRNYGSRFDRCLEEVMDDEGVTPSEFFVRGMEEVSLEGGFRKPHLTVSAPTSEVSGDAARLGFALPRGGYATVLLREIIKPRDPFASGFA